MSFKATLVGDDPSSQLSFFDLDVPVRMMNLIMRKMVRGIALPTLFRRRKKKIYAKAMEANSDREVVREDDRV